MQDHIIWLYCDFFLLLFCCVFTTGRVVVEAEEIDEGKVKSKLFKISWEGATILFIVLPS
jgi:hypothetical protein